jgi:hypothetical protein
MFKKLVLPVLFVAGAVFAVRGDDSEAIYRSAFAYSLAVPLSPSEFSDYWKVGSILTWSEELDFVDGPIGGRVSLDIGWFSFNTDRFYKDFGKPANVSIDVSPTLLINVDLMLKWYLMTSHKIPYITAGLGYASLLGGTYNIYSGNRLLYSGYGADNDALSFSIGAGADIPLSVFRVSAEVRYAGLIGVGGYTSYFPIRVGISLPFSFIMSGKEE